MGTLPAAEPSGQQPSPQPCRSPPFESLSSAEPHSRSHARRAFLSMMVAPNLLATVTGQTSGVRRHPVAEGGGSSRSTSLPPSATSRAFQAIATSSDVLLARRCFRRRVSCRCQPTARTRVLTALPGRSRTKTPSRPFGLATARASLPDSLLAARSRTRTFESPGRQPGTGHHPGNSSPSPISGFRRSMGHVASGVSRRGTRSCRVVSRPRITFPGAGPPGFQAAECRSSALPTERVRSLFGTVSLASHQQALTGLSPLNFSRPEVFPPVPEIVVSRSVCLTTAELPALAHVERTSASHDAWPGPRGWIWQHVLVSLAPLMITTTGDRDTRVDTRARQARRGRFALPHRLRHPRPHGVAPRGLSRSSRLRCAGSP